MNKDELNIAIAEHFGWRNCRIIPLRKERWDDPNKPEFVHHGFPPKPGSVSFHDYAGDLNAMHEVEATLDHDEYDRFVQNLEDILYSVPYPIGGIRVASACAAHRAEAFLKTVNKGRAMTPTPVESE